MGSTFFQRAFSSGELAPALSARADLAKYATALRTCRNFIVQRHGGAALRPGTYFCGKAKSDGPTWLYPFVFPEADASFAIEAGEFYLRFWRRGVLQTVAPLPLTHDPLQAYETGDLCWLAGVNYYARDAHTGAAPPNGHWYAMPGNIYQIPTPYPTGSLMAPQPLQWDQGGLSVTLTHLGHPPMELSYARVDERWVLRPIVIGVPLEAPTGLAAVGAGAGTDVYSYVVTAVTADGQEGSASEPASTAPGNKPTPTAPNVLTWDETPGAVEYRVYGDNGQGRGVYGYLGRTLLNDCGDPGDPPADLDYPPPIARVLFDAPLTYPAVSATWQQRRLFASSHQDREAVWASCVGYRSNFGISTPLRADDAVTFSLSGRALQPIAHMLGLTHLVLLTTQGEWIVGGDDTGALTPTAINPQQHAYTGASLDVRPVVIGNSIIYLQARGSVLRDLRFDQQVEGYQGRDLTIYSAHLMKGHTIVDLAYAQVPDSIVWAVRDDGVLLGLTYIREEDVWGWHRHDTPGGAVEQVCVVPEDDEDVVYLVVRRTSGGSTYRSIERLASRQWTACRDAYHVDAGVTYRGTATTVVGGLAHLEGASVVAFADGVKTGPLTVSGGSVTLPAPATTVHVGLPFVGELETMELDVPAEALRDKRKRVIAVTLVLEDTVLGFTVGPDAAHQFPVRAATWESPDAMRSDQVEVPTVAQWSAYGRVLLRTSGPAPVTLLGILPHVGVGG